MKKSVMLRNVLSSSIIMFLYLTIALLLLGGCAARIIPLNYSPSSASTATGAVTVIAFKYLPAENGKVAPNQIRNTALGNMIFDQNIDTFFRDAVFKELRFTGIKVDGKTVTLSGEIEEFLIDDLGHNVDWTLKVRYLVRSAQKGDILYDSSKTIQRRTAKFVNVFGAMNETIKLNIEELLKDETFIKTIN